MKRCRDCFYGMVAADDHITCTAFNFLQVVEDAQAETCSFFTPVRKENPDER